MKFHTARVAPEKAVFRPALPSCSLPGMTEMHMKKLSYIDQLKHPNWQRKRLERLDAAKWTCERCAAQEKTLHVHHKQYFKGRMAWEYSDAELLVLCEQCHSDVHAYQDLLSRLITMLELPHPPEMVALGLLAGYAHVNGDLGDEMAQECAAVAGPYFHDGMLGAAASMASAKQIAVLVRESHERWQFPMSPILDEVLQGWEKATPPKDL